MTATMSLLDWQPPEKIVVFPAIRRRKLIESTARRAAAAKDPERTLQAAVNRLRDSHTSRCIPAKMAADDVAKFEMALRVQVSLFQRRGQSA